MARRDDLFWAEFLGIDCGDWATPGISYRPHAGLTGYHGFWCFRRNDRLVVSAPPHWLERLRTIFSGWDQHRLMDPASLVAALGADLERSIGPAFHGYLEPDRFTNQPAPNVRQLLPEDDAAIDRFRKQCSILEWDNSGLSKAGLWRHAYFHGDTVTAMAGYQPCGDGAGHPCVLTHPDFRGGGRGAAVTSAVVADALTNGKLVLYQTLESNEAAVGIALKLGYRRYGSHVAVRLRRAG